MQNNYKNLKGAGKPKPRPLGRLGLLLALLLILTFLISLVPWQKVEAQGNDLTVDVPVGQAFFKKGVDPEPTGVGAKKPDPDPKGNDYTVNYQMTFIDGPNNSGLGPMPWNVQDKSYKFSVKGNQRDQDSFTLQLNFEPLRDSPGIYRYMLEISPDQDARVSKRYNLDTSRYICQVKVLNSPSPGQGFKLAGLAFIKEGQASDESKLLSICFSHVALMDDGPETTTPKKTEPTPPGSGGHTPGGKDGNEKPGYVGRKGGAPNTGETHLMTVVVVALLLLAIVLFALRRYKAKNT